MGAVLSFIRELQSYEQYAFSRAELLEKTAAPDSSIKKELARLVSDNQLINLRKGFYVIIPPSFQHFKKIPIDLYVNKLFNYLDKAYYVGFYSAAAYYGASHQRVQQDYVITTPPALRHISKGNIKIKFFNFTNWPANNIIQRKSDAGFFMVSSPALTMVDLIENQHNLGGMNRMLAILEELSESIELSDLNNLLSWYSNKSVLQRMGYLFETIAWNGQLAESIYTRLQNEDFYPVLLSARKGIKAGSTGNRWKVDANIELESDL